MEGGISMLCRPLFWLVADSSTFQKTSNTPDPPIPLFYFNYFRIVARKIVSWLKIIFFELVTIFCERPGTKSHLTLIFCNTFNVGLPSFTFTRWQTQYAEGEHPKHVHKRRFYSDYFTHYSGRNSEFYCKLFSYM